MSDEDKQDFAQVRPLVIGIAALIFRVTHRTIGPPAEAFDEAEAMVAEFERRNGIQ